MMVQCSRYTIEAQIPPNVALNLPIAVNLPFGSLSVLVGERMLGQPDTFGIIEATRTSDEWGYDVVASDLRSITLSDSGRAILAFPAAA